MMTEILKEYTLSAIMISAMSALFTIISPDGEMKKYISLISSLCVIAVIAVPTLSLISSFGDVDSALNTDIIEVEPGHDVMIYEAKEIIEKRMDLDIESRFNIKSGVVKTSITLDMSDTSSIDITEIYITVPRGTDVSALEKYVSDMFLNTASVIITESEYE